jgi:hypothetical protein
MTQLRTRLEKIKDFEKLNRLVRKTQTWRGDKSRANLEYGAANVRLRVSYTETILTVSARDAKLSGDQEDKLVSLRTLQGVLYTTGYETITNY